VTDTETHPDPLLDVKGAAAYLGVGRSTMYKLLSCGSIVASRYARKTRIRRSELDRFVESCRYELPCNTLPITTKDNNN